MTLLKPTPVSVSVVPPSWGTRGGLTVQMVVSETKAHQNVHVY